MGRPRDGGESRDKQPEQRRRAALCQPLRMRIARRLEEGEEASAEELAAELGAPRGRVAYHLRVLAKCGALQVVPRCNPASPRYRWRDEAQWARLLLEEEEARGR
jgi:DNA-binding transcriptional ArsR family regulator